MMHYTKYLILNTKKRKEIVNITDEVAQAVKESKIREGICLVNSMHITSSVFINDEEQGLKEDFLEWLEKIAPEKSSYKHHNTGEDNADAHLKRTIMGREVVVAVTNGRLDFGPWEQIFYGEFDGQRNKKVLIKIIGE
ncbi:MAG: secondary thiamine-phosphate synthase enzyme YjbQ [Candidatus Woesearchaeota archaeon]